MSYFSFLFFARRRTPRSARTVTPFPYPTLFRSRAFEQGEVDRRAGVQVHVVAVQPLPQLRARGLGGGGVFHQVVNRHAAVAVEPCGEIPHTDLDVAVEAGDRKSTRLNSSH